MPSPVTPQSVLALLPNSSNGACNEIDKLLLQTPQQMVDLVTYMFKTDATVSTAFATDICAALVLIGCAGGTTSTTTAGTGTVTTTTTSTTTDGITTVWYAGTRVEDYRPFGFLGRMCGAEADVPVELWFAGRSAFGTVNIGNGLRTKINDATPIWTGSPSEIFHHRVLAWNPSTQELWTIYQARRRDRTQGVTRLSYIDKVTKATGVAASAVGVAMPLDAEYYSAVWNPAGTILYAARGASGAFADTTPKWAGSGMGHGVIAVINTATGAETSIVSTGLDGGDCRIYSLEYVGNTLYCIGFKPNLFFGTVNPVNGVVTHIADLSLSETSSFIDWYYSGYPYGILSTTLCLVYKGGVMYMLVMDGICAYKNLYRINLSTGETTFVFPLGTDGVWSPIAFDASLGTMPIYLEAGT